MDYLQIISKNKVLNEWEEKCVNRLSSLIVHPRDTYTVLWVDHNDNKLELLRQCDNMRMKWLACHPEGCYIDLDCYIEELFIPPCDGKCYLPRYGDRIDIFYIFTNGNIKFIRENFKPYKKKNTYGWPQNQLKKILSDNKCGIIPEECYTHTFTSLQDQMERRRVECEVLKF